MRVHALAALATAVVVGCAKAGPIPAPPARWVTDPGGYLSPGVATALDLRLRDYQTQAGHSVLVWISKDRLPMPIEDFGFQAFNSWGVGRAGIDDGIVLLIFPAEPRLRMRIQVGYGLERAIPDREAVRILRSVGPDMEKGHHDEGVVAAVDAILADINRGSPE